MTVSPSTRTRLDTVVRSFRMIQKMNRGRPEVKPSENLYYQFLTGYFTRILNAGIDHKPLVLHTIFMPAEILYAMDIVPMHAETTSWMVPAFTGSVGEMLAKASELGLAPEICSAHRVLTGALACGDLPRPDAVTWSNLCCDNSAKSSELLLELTDAPGYFVDIPFSDSPAEIAYGVKELRGLIEFLERTTGRQMDWQKLSDIIARLNHQIDLYQQIYELRKAVPSPFPMHRFAEFMMSSYLMPGHPEVITYLETLRAELSEMVRLGQGAVQPEKFRLMSLFIPPVYLMGLLGEVSRQTGAVSVVEPLFGQWGDLKLDPERPLESLVKKSLAFPECASYGPLNERILAETERCARQFKVDGAVLYAHVGCRQGAALIKTYRDMLSRIDVPLFVLDMDLLDQTITSADEIKTKLLQFVEILEDR
ncbi:MAG TPA: 2-hydroxyacyl-CoA dehydratase family protein [Dehalococcoidales bacterium]|nr:2-hydroxyacyl-CoA dehydratase family protein [Dehalococcoidales bacterium]